MSISAAIHERFMNASRTIPPRVGGGVGGRGGVGLEHASYLTAGAVDNPLASATTAPGSDVACNASGEIRGWVR